MQLTKLNKALAKELNNIFLEVVIANGFDPEALKILKKNLRMQKIYEKFIDATMTLLNERFSKV